MVLYKIGYFHSTDRVVWIYFPHCVSRLGYVKPPKPSQNPGFCSPDIARSSKGILALHRAGVPYPEGMLLIKGYSLFQNHRRGMFFPNNFLSLSSFCTCPDPETARSSGFREVKAQAALMDYLQFTRGLQFNDAESMSKNSPIFLRKLLKEVQIKEDVRRSLNRFFRYHPINEFEPFFESIGLKPVEFAPFLPRDLIYLTDADKMIENYHDLCNYGIPRGKIGKIYKGATEVFSYGRGVLASKLQAFESVGLNNSNIIKFVASCPYLLVGEVNKEFVKALHELESIGIHPDWVAGSLSDKDDYDWGRVLISLHFLSGLDLKGQGFVPWLKKHSFFLLDNSGKTSFLVLGLLLKVGVGKSNILSLFSQFPRVEVGTFLKNLVRSLGFLTHIRMHHEDISRIFCSYHASFLGQCKLKKANSILCSLGVGKSRLCKIIMSNPLELKGFALGNKLTRLPNSLIKDNEKSLMQKKQFLLSLGYVENSKEMRKALETFRGKGSELKDRFNFLVQNGIDKDDVSSMMRIAPHVLNQKIDVLEHKINFLLSLGYPVKSLVSFPSYLSYTNERVMLRLRMYNWLTKRGKVSKGHALSSILACSDKVFVKKYVSRHNKGSEVWERLRKELNYKIDS